MAIRNRTRKSHRATDEDDCGSGDIHHPRVTAEIFGAMKRQIPRLNDLEKSAIAVQYQLERNFEVANEELEKNPEAFPDVCAQAIRSLAWLLQCDLAHELRQAGPERAKALRTAIEVVKGDVLVILSNRQPRLD